jgi:hypothetical protein
VIAGTSIAREIARYRLAGSRYVVPALATNAPSVEPADMLNDNGATGSGDGKV